MARIERFEDLKCWQQARYLANVVSDLTEQESFARDFKLRGQIQSAGGSVMHNIAEGFDAGSDAEFVRFLKMSRRSASEIQSQLYLALDRQYIIQEELRTAYEKATEVKRLINGLIGYLHKTKSWSHPAESGRPLNLQARQLPNFSPTTRLRDYKTS
jgi:four helix bundle protein